MFTLGTNNEIRRCNLPTGRFRFVMLVLEELAFKKLHYVKIFTTNK